ncbi:unnamed protein product, partial [marine sediment metagenome]
TSAQALANELGCYEDTWFETAYTVCGPDFNAEMLRYYFGPETPFRFVAPGISPGTRQQATEPCQAARFRRRQAWAASPRKPHAQKTGESGGLRGGPGGNPTAVLTIDADAPNMCRRMEGPLCALAGKRTELPERFLRDPAAGDLVNRLAIFAEKAAASVREVEDDVVQTIPVGFVPVLVRRHTRGRHATVVHEAQTINGSVGCKVEAPNVDEFTPSQVYGLHGQPNAIRPEIFRSGPQPRCRAGRRTCGVSRVTGRDEFMVE